MKKLNNSHFPAISQLAKSKPWAYSYFRWSTAVQGSGDSFRRQMHLAVEWCEENGIPLADERTMVDAGVSAFKGRNLKNGALGAFLKSAQEGKIPRGSYLLIESFDRLSRQGAFKTASIVQEIWEHDITIVTLGDKKVYPPNCNDLDALYIVLVAIRAKEESQLKSFRVGKSWHERIKNFRETGILPTGNLPAWLSKDANGRAVVDEHKAAIIRRIFDWSISGLGMTVMAKTLNNEGVKPFAMEKRSKGVATYWTVASISYLLTNKSVYGDYHPPKSEPIIGAFPAIVSREDFYHSQAARATRKKIGMGCKGEALTNLFAGVAKCYDCREPMYVRAKKKGNDGRSYYCQGRLSGVCTSKHWNYGAFEKTFLEFVNEIDLQSIVYGGTESRAEVVTSEMQSLEGQLQDTQKSLDAFIDMMTKTPALAPTITEPMLAQQTRLQTIKERMSALERERSTIQTERRASNESNRVTFPSDIPVSDLYAMRAKAAQHIKTVVDVILLKKDEGKEYASFFVSFRGGTHRTVHVDSNGRPVMVSGDKPEMLVKDPTSLLDQIYNDIKEEHTDWLKSKGRAVISR